MASAFQIITKVTFIILKAAEDCCKKWRQKNEGEEQTGKHQLTGSSSCTNMKCYSEIQSKPWSSIAFQIVLLNNAIKTCHLDRLTLSTSLAYLIFHVIFSLPSLARRVHFSTRGGRHSRRARENSSFQNPPTSRTDAVLWPSKFRNEKSSSRYKLSGLHWAAGYASQHPQHLC